VAARISPPFLGLGTGDAMGFLAGGDLPRTGTNKVQRGQVVAVLR
jgi:hypothetical protein